MRNLIYFLNRNSFLFLFLFLETICFIMIFRYNHYQRATYLSSANSVSGRAYEIKSGVSNYFQLNSVNNDLSDENLRLLNENNILKMMLGTDAPNSLVIDSTRKSLQSARVINNSTNKRHNFITIDKGYKDGVKRDMGVISADGVVGIVKDASKNFASIISVLHIDFKLSCKLKGKDYFGSLTWDGVDRRYAFIRDIPGHADIVVGDEIVSSGYGSIFPAEIMVGKVNDISNIPGSSFQKIEIELSVDFSRLHNTYLVTNENREEKLELEQRLSSE